MNIRCLFGVFTLSLVFVLICQSGQLQGTRKTTRPHILVVTGRFGFNFDRLQNAALKSGTKLEVSPNFAEGYDGVLAFAIIHDVLNECA